MRELEDSVAIDSYMMDSIATHRKLSKKHYWKIIILISIFYGLPAVPYVFYQFHLRSNNMDKDVCYFNDKCKHSYGIFYAFNNIISNIGYTFLGFLFMFIVKFSNVVHNDKSIYYALGLSLIFEGSYSALYHVCPSSTNFQFDTTFMIIGTGLLLISYLQKRTVNKVIGIFKLFAILALFIVLTAFDLTYKNDDLQWYWFICFFLLLGISFYVSYRIYYFDKILHDQMINYQQFSPGRPLLNPGDDGGVFLYRENNKFNLQKIKDFLKYNPKRLVFIALGNLLNWIFVLVCYYVGVHFPTIIIGLLIMDLAIVKFRYICFTKIKKNEQIKWYVWIYMVLSVVFWISALWFFDQPTSDKFLTPEKSRELNTPCILFGFFDTHDIWHFLSAGAIFMMFLTSWYIDADRHSELVVDS